MTPLTRTLMKNWRFVAAVVGVATLLFVTWQLYYLIDTGLSFLKAPRILDEYQVLKGSDIPVLHKEFDKAADSAQPIPCHIHQLWKTKDLSTYPKPASQDAWKRRYPECKYTLWTDSDLNTFIAENYTWLYPAYAAFPHPIQRADIARLAVLHHFGGVYADLDVHPNTGSIHNLRKYDSIIPMDYSGAGLTNHFLIARPQSKLFGYLLYKVSYRTNYIVLPYLRVMWSTGPVFMTQALLQFSSPVYKSGSNENNHLKDIVLLENKFLTEVAGHGAGRSWMSSDGKFLNHMSDNWAVYRIYVLTTVVLLLILSIVFVRRFKCWRRM